MGVYCQKSRGRSGLCIRYGNRRVHGSTDMTAACRAGCPVKEHLPEGQAKRMWKR
jgi:hypothetical protein